MCVYGHQSILQLSVNIFILDNNHVKCAQSHCDKHIVKMVIETAQLLCSAHWMTGRKAPYRKTHASHPCSVWIRASIENYRWAIQHGMALCEEYTKRYGKIHKTQAVIKWCKENEPELPDCGLTDFIQAMPDGFKNPDVVKAYRAYYKATKSEIARWNYSSVPDWWENKIS